MGIGPRVWGLSRPEYKTLLIGLLFLIISSGMNLIYPQAVRRIVDEAIGAKNMDLVTQATILMVVVFMIQAVTSSLRYYYFTLAGERIVFGLRSKLYSHLISLDLSFFDQNRTGDLQSRLTSDCGVLQNAVSVNVSMALRHLGGVVGGLVLMGMTSPSLTGITLVVIPPVAIMAAIFGRRIRKASRESQDAIGQSQVVAEETLSGLRTVRQFGQEEFERERFRDRLGEAMVATVSKMKEISWFFGLVSMLGYLSIAAVLWLGGKGVVSGQMSVGDLTQFLLYLVLVAFSVGSLANLWGDFQAAMGAGKRVFDILDLKPTVSDRIGKVLSSITGAIEFRNIHLSYPSRPDIEVLRGIQLRVSPGQKVALVGPSGCGKSSLASLLSRLYEPTDGVIEIDGVAISEIQPLWLRRNIGVVSQEPILISETIAENIRYGTPKATTEEIHRAAKDANALEFIQKFPEGFETRVGERGVQLSGGQKQRIAIARAILKDPKILILDEATSSLDTASERLVQEALDRLAVSRTTLIIAHRLTTIRSADVIAVMDHGQIVQTGNHESLLADSQGLYHRLIHTQ
jgi:ABC transporter fused permease/ATP-binding protein